MIRSVIAAVPGGQAFLSWPVHNVKELTAEDFPVDGAS